MDVRGQVIARYSRLARCHHDARVRDASQGLGCGDPVTPAALGPGETVLDLGSGPGFDCLVAAHFVGRGGRVVGVDMTAEMARLAARNAVDAGVRTANYLVGDMERLPLRDASFDVVISNCAINLCRDKKRVLEEAYRVLRPGGRLAVCDVIAHAHLPDRTREDLALYTGCVAGALTAGEYVAFLQEARFDAVQIQIRKENQALISSWAPGAGLERFIASAEITATKP